jgi:hypothetical protein
MLLLGARCAFVTVGLSRWQESCHRSIAPADGATSVRELVSTRVADLVGYPNTRSSRQVDALDTAPGARLRLQEVRRAGAAHWTFIDQASGLLYGTFAANASPRFPIALPAHDRRRRVLMCTRLLSASGTWHGNEHSWIARRAVLTTLIDTVRVDYRPATLVTVSLAFVVQAHWVAACHSSSARTVRHSAVCRREDSKRARRLWRPR